MAEHGAEAAPEQDPEPGAAVDPPAPADRRSFLRQLSTDAVWTAGKLAGASAVLRRSLMAAGESAIETLEGASGREAGTVTAAGASAAAVAPAGSDRGPGPADRGSGPDSPSGIPASALVAERPAPPPTAPPDPVAALTAAQHAFLVDAASAVLAVNDPAGHPLLALSAFHWDGALVRMPARDFTARTIDIDRDPKVALLIDDPASGAWVAINGVASLLYGERVEGEMRLILAKYHDADDVTGRWEQLRSAGDQVVIHIRPTRFVWRSA